MRLDPHLTVDTMPRFVPVFRFSYEREAGEPYPVWFADDEDTDIRLATHIITPIQEMLAPVQEILAPVQEILAPLQEMITDTPPLFVTAILHLTNHTDDEFCRMIAMGDDYMSVDSSLHFAMTSERIPGWVTGACAEDNVFDSNKDAIREGRDLVSSRPDLGHIVDMRWREICIRNVFLGAHTSTLPQPSVGADAENLFVSIQPHTSVRILARWFSHPELSLRARTLNVLNGSSL